LRLKGGPDALLSGIRGGLRGYLGKIRSDWGRKQPKTCFWVSVVGGKEILQRSLVVFSNLKTANSISKNNRDTGI